MKIKSGRIHKIPSAVSVTCEESTGGCFSSFPFLCLSPFFLLCSLVLHEEIKEWMVYSCWIIQHLNIFIPCNQSMMAFEINILTLFCFYGMIQKCSLLLWQNIQYHCLAMRSESSIENEDNFWKYVIVFINNFDYIKLVTLMFNLFTHERSCQLCHHPSQIQLIWDYYIV